MIPDDDAQPDAEDDAGVRRIGRALGLAGFAPFALLALWLFGIALDHPWRPATIALLTGYAAVILSFLGGTRWGIAVRGGRRQDRRDLIVSIVPPLIGWTSLFSSPPVVFVLLAVAYAAQGAWDSLTLGGSGPDWFRTLRIRLTFMAVAALLLAFVATG